MVVRQKRANLVWVLAIVSTIAAVGCAGKDAGVRSAATPPSVTTAEVPPSGDVALVGINNSQLVANFFDLEGTIVDSVAVPEKFVPVDTDGPSAFIYGPNAALTKLVVVDAKRRAVAAYDVPLSTVPTVKLNASTALLFREIDGVVRPHAVDLATGTLTDLVELAGPSATQAALAFVHVRDDPDVVRVFDDGFAQTLVIPRADPLASRLETVSVKAVKGSTTLGMVRTPGTDSFRAHLQRNGAEIELPSELRDGSRLELVTPDVLLVLTEDGSIVERNLDSGVVTELGTVGADRIAIRMAGPGVGIAYGESFSTGRAFSLRPFRVLSDLGQEVSAYHHATRCTLLRVFNDSSPLATTFMFDASTSAIGAEVGTDPIVLSADGCSAFSPLTNRLIVAGTTYDLVKGWGFAVSADGSRAVVRPLGGSPQLVIAPALEGKPLPSDDTFHFVP